MIAQANRLDNGELVEGFYTNFDHLLDRGGEFIEFIDDLIVVEIDSSTLKYKVNDQWYSEEDIETAMEAKEYIKELADEKR